MATLDQLPPEQRAIVELVVQRGRSYETLAEVLQVPQARVRELAREALTELSPRTASRVDVDRRGQVADYLMRQQSPEEERATRDYLKQSESARAWALSLLDSLDPLYANGGAPSVPEAAAGAAADEAVAEPTVEDRLRTRERERVRKEPEPEEEEPEAKPEPKRERERDREALSPEAESALRRRRILGAIAGVALLAGIVLAVLAIAGVFSSDKKSSSSSTPASTTSSTTSTGSSTTAGQPPVQVVGGIALNPIGKNNKSQGVAYVVQQGSQRYVVIQAKVPPLPNNQKVAAYEVWLYNSNTDARSLGAQYTNAQGVLQGRAPLPADVGKFKSIDISRELFADKNASHSNTSLLRGDFSSIKPVQQPGGTPTTPGATTTPGGASTTPAP
jgi:hypothetical protein